MKYNYTAILILYLISSVTAWSNGGYSDNASNPDYGTHDWIAEKALDWLPESEKFYLMNYTVFYLYGTELPDNPYPADGIGDTVKHHVYFNLTSGLTDNSSAERAEEEFQRTLEFLKAGNYSLAAKNAGIMSHYLSDVAVFGHVMGSGMPWGSETHHSDYESYVNNHLDEFDGYLEFDGELDRIPAYNATIGLAYDTTFVGPNCTWMDQDYNWSDSVFRNRAGGSLNLAVNYLADVLHSLCPVCDSDCDGKISDFELLECIGKWSQGLTSDSDLLGAIENWISS